MNRLKVFVLLSSLIYSQLVFCTAAQFLESIYNLIASEYDALVAQLSSFKSYSKSLLSAEEQSTDTIALTIAELNKDKMQYINTKELGAFDFYANYGGASFRVGGIASSSCIRHKNNQILNNLTADIFPVVREIKQDIKNKISTENYAHDSIIFYGNNVADAVGVSDEILNPFDLKKNISIDDARRLSDVILFMVDKSPPQVNRNPNDPRAYDYESKRLRYESFVDIVQNALMNHVGSFVVDENNDSQNDLINRLQAKANSKTVALSMSVKFKSGRLKELNGALSDLLIVEHLNEQINKDITALLTVIATGVTDDIGDKL